MSTQSTVRSPSHPVAKSSIYAWIIGSVLMLIILGGIAYVVVEYISIGQVNIGVKNIQYNSVTISGIKATAIMEVHNNAPVMVSIPQQYIELYIDDQLLTVINQDMPVEVSPRSSVKVLHPVDVSFVPSINILYKIINNQPINIREQGYFVVRSHLLNFETRKTINWSEVYVSK